MPPSPQYSPRARAHLRILLSRVQRAAAEAGASDATAVGGTSYSNREEGRAVAELVAAVLAEGELKPEQIGVITPYSAQVSQVLG